MSVKYSWSRQNGAAMPSVQFMSIEPAENYYRGMPLKLKEKGIVEPTDGDPEYICMAEYNPGTEIQPLEIPVQEVFPDVVYDRMNEDGSIEEVRFGSKGGGADLLNKNGKLKNEVLPDGYPYEEEQNILIEWDGNTEGLEPFEGYVKISDEVLTKEQLIGANLSCVDADGTNISLVLTEGDMTETATGVTINHPYSESIVINNAGISTFIAGNEPTDLGVWVIAAQVKSFRLETKISTVHTIDAKFLPPEIGGGCFVVRFISDESMNLTCELSYDEILAKHKKGIIAGAIIFDDEIMMQYPNVTISEDDGSIYFCNVAYNGEKVIIGHVWITIENVVNFFSREITTS